MLNKLTMLGVLVFAIHGAVLAQQVTDPGPSLQETERWIKQTFTDENVWRTDCEEFSSEGIAAAPVDTRCWGTSYNLTLNGCDAELWLLPYKSEGTKAGLQKQQMDMAVITFNLGAIDPSSIKVGEPVLRFGNKPTLPWHDNDPVYRNVTFSTTDNADAITLEHPDAPGDHHSFKEHDCCGLLQPGIAARPDYAPRFAKAFRHAVELCGGKASAF